MSEPDGIAFEQHFVALELLVRQGGLPDRDATRPADPAVAGGVLADNCQFYSASLTQRAQKRFDLVSHLRQAIDRNEFSLVYQPQFDLASGRIHSVEALIRWNHPTDGTISPMDFIPLAEENGLIVPIGEWVMRTACSDAAPWQREGHGLTVAVNLSPMQFKDPNLVSTALEILAETGLAAEFLELEVTETAVMEDSTTTLATLEALHVEGVQIALDDFGTGYSSMNYLKRMPLNNLKVDQSLVQGLPHDRDNHAIVRAMELLMMTTGVRMVHVPYKGVGLALGDLLGGQIDLMFPAIASGVSHHRSGRLRGPGITSPRRHPSVPELPTVSDTIPRFESRSWIGVLMPARTPKTIVAHANRAIVAIVNKPEVRQALVAQGADPETNTPEAFASFIRDEVARAARVVKAAGIKPE